MLPFLSGVIGVILPCLAYESDSRRNIKETATALNLSLLKLVAIEAGDDCYQDGDLETGINMTSVIEVLLNNLISESVQTKVAVLEWIHHLYTQMPSRMEKHTSQLIFPALLKVLSDKSDEVVVQCLLVLAEGVAKKHASTGLKAQTEDLHYKDFLKCLLDLFRSDKQLLDERGSFILRHLCVLLNAEDIYRTLANILLYETNLKFTSTMVETLNMLLLTASELYVLRNILKNLKSQESVSLFICLYKCWAHSPVSTIALCLLSQNYQHVSDLVKLFGNLELTVDLLTELDKLIQLIESPIFAYLRLELLSSSRGAPLLSALYGILMLLPQTKSFHILKARLDCVPALNICCQTNERIVPTKDLKNSNVDFNNLLEHFNKVQSDQTAYKAQQRAYILSTLQRDMNLVQN
uniref:Protein VAC14 homolog n=1 Tax=Xenopsylla cheopis TaxID=163159 RepID=A0A6M2DYB2_XENCH